MITLLSAASAEEITLAVQEFIAQFLPQFLPTFEKYSIIFTGVIAGVGLIIAIIASIIKLKASKNKLKAAVTPYERNKELIDAMHTEVLDSLQGTFDVDITNKLNPIIDGVVKKTNTDIAVINEKINAIANAQLAITKVFANSGALTQDEYNELIKAISGLPETQNQKEIPAHVQFSLGDAPQEKNKNHKIAV